MPFASSSSLRSLGARSIPLAAAATLTVSLYAAHQHLKPVLRNDDTPYELVVEKRVLTGPVPGIVPSPYTPLGWGSNKYMTLVPEAHTKNLKRPMPLPQLGATPLRDLAVQEKYGACVDARGDLWMWGVGYDPSGDVSRSLRGKKLVTLAAGPGKVFGLSKDGRLFVVSADRAFQDGQKAGRNWWKKLTTRDPLVDFVELKAGQKFGWGEKWASVAVGQYHLLAVTNKGRTFSLPLTPSANTHRQLGTKQTFEAPSKEAALAGGPLLPPEMDPRFATQLTEIPALSGISIAQVAASDRSSFVRTPEGRVLGFGANDFGQIGLGPQTTIATVPTPVEIALARYYPSGSSVRCVNVVAGGQTTLFTVEQKAPGSALALCELLSCGNGQSGALGSGVWSSAMYGPSKVKALSGLQEYSEAAKAMIPLQLYSVAICNDHVVAALDTIRQADAKGVDHGLFGKDVMVWGGNNEYQLGNGKRSSLASPIHLPSLIPHAIDTLVADSKEEAESPMPVTRLQLHQSKADAYDLNGKLIRRGVKAEETIVPGYDCSILYNKIIE